ncbi:hypothetical protein [Pseudomarimonas salicorniae]|uniref:Uncharacterized protein n=1 Tax=Pseudomarimonas salicorniae TaxID=2933270 RepID=A0ABT0GM25_9GAMM|nr:hypothetical protein [Lysobacter sp. CAU 1642]MCK7595597.1 hypothetical protein [Lysobacter sp. CAU 1642]
MSHLTDIDAAPMVNRGAIILRPAQPYLDWAASLGGGGPLPSADGEQAVYLVDEWENDRSQQRILQRCFAELFEQELGAWCTDESLWPKKRDLATFKKWFRVEMHSLVVDVSAEPLELVES